MAEGQGVESCLVLEAVVATQKGRLDEVRERRRLKFVFCLSLFVCRFLFSLFVRFTIGVGCVLIIVCSTVVRLVALTTVVACTNDMNIFLKIDGT